MRAGGTLVDRWLCRPQDLRTAKYELVTSLRTHLGSQDDAFGCMGVSEDPSGYQGTFLKKNVMEVVDDALKTNVRGLAPRILPGAELVSTQFSPFLHY